MKNSNLSVVSILLSFSNAKSPFCPNRRLSSRQGGRFYRPRFRCQADPPSGLSIVHLMRNIFPRWVNTVPIKLIIALGMTGGAVVAGITYYDPQIHASRLSTDTARILQPRVPRWPTRP